MAKVKNSFNLSKHELFTINTPSGSYEIPALETLAYDDWKDVAAVSNGKDVRALIRAYKEFFLRVCPALVNEGIGDSQWVQLGNAYMAYMGE